MLSLVTDVSVFVVQPWFISMRWRKRPLEGCLRSDGLSGSRPRKAAMRKRSIGGCLLLLLLSNCSTPRAGAVILIAVFTPRIAVDATEGFGFLGAVVDEDGTINHTL